MKGLFKLFRGNGKKQLMKDLIDSNKSLNINISDRLFDLLEENNNLEDKYFKLDSENKENIKLIELREKDIKSLEKKVKQEKPIRAMLQNMDNKVNCAMEKIDSIMNAQNELLDLLKEFKGNIYEVKPIRKCIGSKQKIQVKPSAKNSSIIKKVVGTSEK